MKAILFSILSFCFVASHAQTVYEFTSAQSRLKHDKSLIDNVINGNLRRPLTKANEGKWAGAFWAMELLLYKTQFTQQKIQQAWRQVADMSESFQKTLLEVSYTLYKYEFVGPVKNLMKKTSSPTVFIRCAEYLLAAKKDATATKEIELARKNFENSDFIGFELLKKRMLNRKEAMPPLKDLFATSFLPGEVIIYSLHRRSRSYAGLVVIRKADGSFVKNDDGSFFHTSQLARAITNYPFYITNGNTPQGIFRWTGFDTSSISYIGPTTNLQMVMPYEAGVPTFFNDSTKNNQQWSKEIYTSLLPSSWKKHDGIYESYWAGNMGRYEIIMHGTTINPAYYKGQTYFPQTPSLGCLCSYEEWDKNGKLVNSHQQKIVTALNGIGSKSGYVVVIELDNKKAAVRLKEIANLIP